jgi:ElaB/YqjD/DUF883 family membrane-anchored ribosome-binding protein
MGEEPTPVRTAEAGRAASDTLGTPADEPAQIRADIEQTRADMAETIDAIQDRISPQRVFEQAKETVRDATVGKVKDMANAASNTASELVDDVQDRARQAVGYVRENPLPAALIGAGIAWFVAQARSHNRPRPFAYERDTVAGAAGTPRQPPVYVSRHTRHGWWETVSDNPVPAALTGLGIGWMMLNRGPSRPTSWSPARGYGATDVRAGGASWIERGQSAVGDAARQAQEAAGEVTERAQETWQHYSQRAETEFERWMRENPWTVGAAAVAVGAAVGLSVPSTETENAWLGETRDTLVERAQEAVQGTVDQAKQAVENVSQQMTGEPDAQSQASR